MHVLACFENLAVATDSPLPPFLENCTDKAFAHQVCLLYFQDPIFRLNIDEVEAQFNTIGSLETTDPQLLRRWFGKWGRYALGVRKWVGQRTCSPL